MNGSNLINGKLIIETKSIKKDGVYHVIGLMSGTSVDGLDIAYVKFEWDGIKWFYKIIATLEVHYPEGLRQRLLNVSQSTMPEIHKLDDELGTWFGKQVKSFVEKGSFNVDFISSHGHTVFHQPEKMYTLQIGSAKTIYEQTNLPVVNDFRSLDVKLGGQGAPLVPIGDEMLFGEFDFCLNLGGIANISFGLEGVRYAYDICECNLVLNAIARKAGLEYDHGGEMASAGDLQMPLFNKLESLEYYRRPFPKSLGVEWISKNVIPLVEKDLSKLEDKMHTCAQHVAQCIGHDILKVYNQLDIEECKVLVTGGGAFNNFVISSLESILSGVVEVLVGDEEIVRFKEALVFAFLGVRTVRNEYNCIASVTGASSNSVGGLMFGFD